MICPYFLRNAQRAGLYVIAYDDPRGALRTFSLERGRRRAARQHLHHPDDFDPTRTWLRPGRDEQVEVEAAPSLAMPRVRESVWYHSQRLSDTPNGGCELEMRVGGIREVRSWVLSWGADVEVLGPPQLRDEVADHARRMSQQYAVARPAA